MKTLSKHLIFWALLLLITAGADAQRPNVQAAQQQNRLDDAQVTNTALANQILNNKPWLHNTPSPIEADVDLTVWTINTAGDNDDMPKNAIRLVGIAQKLHQAWPHQVGLIGMQEAKGEMVACKANSSCTNAASCFAAEMQKLYGGQAGGRHTGGTRDENGIVAGNNWRILGHRSWDIGQGFAGMFDGNRKLLEAYLEHKTEGYRMRFYSVHLSPGGDAEEARHKRRAQTRKIISIIKERAKAGELPPIIVGDFNTGRSFRQGAKEPEKSVRLMEENFWRPIDLVRGRSCPETVVGTGIDIIYIGRKGSFPKSRGSFIPVKKHFVDIKTPTRVNGYPSFYSKLSDHNAEGFSFSIRGAHTDHLLHDARSKVLAADVNGDGLTDEVFLFANTWDNNGLVEIRTKISKKDGTWWWKSQKLQSGGGILDGHVLTGDLDGNGRQDIVFVFSNTWSNGGLLEIRSLHFDDKGNWNSRGKQFTDGPGVVRGKVLIGDIDGNKREDVIFAFANNGLLEIRTKHYNANGSWTSTSKQFTDGAGVLNGKVLAGDIDGNGRTDIIFAFSNTWSGNGQLEIRTRHYHPNGSWTAGGKRFTDGPGVLKGKALTADIDGNGRTDIIFAFINNGQLEIRTRHFNANGSWTAGGKRFTDGAGVLNGKVLMGDIDGNGREDIIFAFANNGLLEIRTRHLNANGSWRAERKQFLDGAGVLKGNVLTGNVNGDSKTDLIFVFDGNWKDNGGLDIRNKFWIAYNAWTASEEQLWKAPQAVVCH